MDSGRQLIVFSLDGRNFGLPLEAVERVERAVEITALPKLPANVMGVVNLRGQIIPVFNLRRRLKLPEREIDPSDQFIFAHTKRRLVGFLVDAVSVSIEPMVREMTAVADLVPGLMDCRDGVGATSRGLAFVHDLDAFLSLEEDQALTEALKHHV